ncbi:AraC-like DNA-binding protein [Rhizobium sp. SG_E_25_P2]|uniref:helix-turn-helix domain-containing protein n=1 Tax=Rhizobium sp. SG_E_25_P2 TaxID=2879942 RepID=UPI002475AABF|nr:helix-turn-helix domain-containing protein [Rhizobium sp. SG_E_25_P2]MDH6268588.1 AraC-like DNA-binding protein [Rhizobium sp. SG_E_25_P2]
MFLALPAASRLAPFVQAYWFVEDLPGEHVGRLIRTSPVPAAVMTVNLGRANTADNGELVPKTSLLGLQSKCRTWRSCADTYFVMVMLTIAGFVRLFPHTGPHSAGALLDLAAVIGEKDTQCLIGGVDVELKPEEIASQLDQWLFSRLGNGSHIRESETIALAHDRLHNGGSVDSAANSAGIGRRQLNRLFHRHLGVSPKEIADLERLQFSLKGVQTGRGDPVRGFADQAHQIRNWRRRLGFTPGAYAREPHTPMAEYFCVDATVANIPFYL